MTHTPIVSKMVLAVVVTFTASCASTFAGYPAPDPDRVQGSSADVITMAELKQFDPGLSVMEAVEHARPWFLHPRGTIATVTIDHSPATESSVLRTITVGDVKEIRLLRAITGAAPVAIRSDGTVAVGDVILVVTATGRL